MNKKLIFAILTALSTPCLADANLITNGSFEIPRISSVSSQFYVLFPDGSKAIDGWIVKAGDDPDPTDRRMDLTGGVPNWLGASDGDQLIDLASTQGFNKGIQSIPINVISGKTYTLTFDIGNFYIYRSNVGVSLSSGEWGDGTVGEKTFLNTAGPLTDGTTHWKTITLTWVAKNTTTTQISFYGRDPGLPNTAYENYDENPFLDNVRLVENLGQVMPAPTPNPTIKPLPINNACSPILIDKAVIQNEMGNAYWVDQSFGTPADNMAETDRSALRLFENGVELKEAHIWHELIRTTGAGKFSHWAEEDGTGESLRFAATDNSNPQTNGKAYTYCVASGDVIKPTPVVVTSPATNNQCSELPISTDEMSDEMGFAYLVDRPFGTPADNMAESERSTLRLFENHVELKGGHIWHGLIRTAGAGKFSHWENDDGTGESLRFSATDNTNPRTNGKTYTYCVGSGDVIKPTPVVVTSPTTNRTIFVATNGSDTNTGTINAPFSTLEKAAALAEPNDTIYIRGGIYNIDGSGIVLDQKAGSKGNLIKIFNYPNELPIFDGSAMTTPDTCLIKITDGASWIHLKGLEVRNNPRGCGITAYSSNNIIEGNNVHHHGALNGWGGGIALGESGAFTSNNLILNNNVHHNRDADEGDADGINTWAAGTGNVIRGNLMWRNADDGLDLWNGSPTLVENNWAWENGYNEQETNVNQFGNGNGFKLGGHNAGRTSSGGHMVRNNVSINNKQNGFVENGSTLANTLYNNTAGGNLSNQYEFTNKIPNVFRNNIGFGKNYLGEGIDDAYNSWTLPVSITAEDAESLDPNSKDYLRIKLGSDLIDKGVDVGIPFLGARPDLGAFEKI